MAKISKILLFALLVMSLLVMSACSSADDRIDETFFLGAGLDIEGGLNADNITMLDLTATDAVIVTANITNLNLTGNFSSDNITTDNLTATEAHIGMLYADSTNITGAGATDHGALTGLSDDDHAQYHTDARGDARYYTEAELGAGQLDSRYYTETELDVGQLDNRYYTETELDNGQLDNRYYTETEIDTNIVTDNITATEGHFTNLYADTANFTLEDGYVPASISNSNKTIYVWSEATGDADGTSKANGYTTIMEAVDSMPDFIVHDYEIIVCNGTKKTGTADGTVAGHLQDDTSAQFVAGDVGKRVYNITDDVWTVITAYNDAGDVTVNDDIFADTEEYVIEATPYRETVYINSDPTNHTAHSFGGQLTLRPEYYWYGTCEANAGTGNITDTSANFTSVEIGDKVMVLSLNGASGAADNYSIGTVIDISAAGAGTLGTSVNATPTTNWRYTICKTEISGSDDGITQGDRSYGIYLIRTQGLTVYGFLITQTGSYAIQAISSSSLSVYGLYFEDCARGVWAVNNTIVGHLYYSYLRVSTAIASGAGQLSYNDTRYSVLSGGTGSIFYIYRGSTGLVNYSYIDDGTYGARVRDVSFCSVYRVYIDNDVTNGLVADNNSAIQNAGNSNNATIPETPAASSDGAYIS